MEKFYRTKVIVFILFAASLLCGTWAYTYEEIPGSFYVFEGDSEPELSSFYHVTSVISSSDKDSYDMDVKYLGLIPLKTVNVQVVKPEEVVPGGESFGVRVCTDGVLVIGVSSTETAGENKSPAYKAGIRTKDIIISVNGKKVFTNEEITDIVKNCDGADITFEIKRGDKNFVVIVKPEISGDSYKIGLWIRDSTAGIGTITYYDTDNGVFAALGHGICDTDTGVVLPLLTADVFRSSITSVVKGKPGVPGELKGIFLEDRKIGTLYKNVNEGVFGILSDGYTVTKKKMSIAFKQDIKEGKATIRCTTDGGVVEEYEIEIARIMLNSGQTTKNMVIRVTDEKLKEKAGGIVQGMSGSPIIQNGKLIGAVTHVLISSPDTGYAIFIENMIERE